MSPVLSVKTAPIAPDDEFARAVLDGLAAPRNPCPAASSTTPEAATCSNRSRDCPNIIRRVAKSRSSKRKPQASRRIRHRAACSSNSAPARAARPRSCSPHWRALPPMCRSMYRAMRSPTRSCVSMRGFRRCACCPSSAISAPALTLPPDLARRTRLGFFPGSTIGNFTPDAACDLLASMTQSLQTAEGAFDRHRPAQGRRPPGSRL